MIELRGMTWGHPRGYDPLVAASAEYQRNHPEITVTWEARSLQAFADQPLDSLVGDYDLVVIDHPHLGDAVTMGVLAPLDGNGFDAELDDLAANSVGPSHRSYQFSGSQWALAIDAAAQVAARRPDLLDTPVDAWSDVIHLAEAGNVVFPLKPVDAISTFFTLCANSGSPCAETMDNLIDPAIGAFVLDQLNAVARHIDRRCFAMDPINALDQMSRSDGPAYAPLLFGYVNYATPGFRPNLLTFENFPVLGQNGPCGSLLGGAGIAVSAQCEHQEQAVAYAYWLAGRECQTTVYVNGGGQPGHAVAWDDEATNRRTNNFFRNTRKTLDLAWLRPRYPGFLSFADAGGDIVNAFVRGELSVPATLERLETAYRSSRRCAA